MTEANQRLASAMQVLAEYILMSEEDVRMTLGVTFKLPNHRRVRISTQPAGQAFAALAGWSGSLMLPIVKDDKEKYEQIKAAVKHLNSLTQRPVV